MTRMSWIPSSEGTALVVLLAVTLAVVAPAAAITVASEDGPDEAEVGETVEGSVVIEDPFINASSTWALSGSSELVDDSATWRVTVLQQGEEVGDGEQVYTGQNFTHELDRENGGDTVEIEVEGEAPAVNSTGGYSYDPPQDFALYDLDSVEGNSESDVVDRNVHHYTNESDTARQAIDDASETINETGAGDSARERLNQSISSYENGNFDNAERIANDAANQAESSEQSQQMVQYAIYGAGALIVLALIGGGVYYWRSQGDDYDKLQ